MSSAEAATGGATTGENKTNGDRYLHPDNLLLKAQRIISGPNSVAIPLTNLPPGLYVTIVLNEKDEKGEHRIIRGTIKRRTSDTIVIEPSDGSLTIVIKKHEIYTILGRKVKGGARRKTHRRRTHKRKSHRR